MSDTTARVPTGLADPRVSVAAVGLGLLLGVIAIGADTGAAATTLVAGALGIASLSAIVVLAKGRVCDLLLLAAVGAMALPFDTYIGYRDHVGGWPGLRLSAADLALLALLPVLSLGALLRRTFNAVPRSVLLAYALLLGQYVVSVINASERGLAAFELMSAVHALATAVLIGAACRRELIRPIIAVVALQVGIHTAFAVAQVATGRPIGAEWFTSATVVFETLETGVVRVRPVGLFDHPIVYANALMMALPVLLAGLFVPAGRLWKAGLLLALGVGVAGLGLTLSRGAWISTAVAGLCLVAMSRRYRLVTRPQLARLVIGAALMGLVLGPPLAPRVYERLAESDAGNVDVRFELNWIAVSMIEAHPLAGVGLSNFIPVMEGYDPTNVMARFPATVHNIYLLEAAEAGLPGLVLFVALFATILTAGVKRLDRCPDLSSRWMAAALIAGLLGFLVSQLADFSHRLEPMRSMVWMYVGLLFAWLRAPEAAGNARV